MNKKITFVSKRKWLNDISSNDTGAIAYDVIGYENDKFIDGNLSIWDCGKKINLNFCFSNEKVAENAANKIRILIESLQELQQALGEAYIHFEETQEDTESYL